MLLLFDSQSQTYLKQKCYKHIPRRKVDESHQNSQPCLSEQKINVYYASKETNWFKSSVNLLETIYQTHSIYNHAEGYFVMHVSNYNHFGLGRRSKMPMPMSRFEKFIWPK